MGAGALAGAVLLAAASAGLALRRLRAPVGAEVRSV
jgi:hypothetical protein